MGKTQIIFATSNEDKLREIRMILKDFDAGIISLRDAGITTEIVEDGKTFRDNAVIKAAAIMKETGKLTLADDSGLEVDVLNGEPGIYSARYLGEDTSYDIKNQSILDRMKDVPEEKRDARFVCAVAVLLPDGEELVARGTLEGRIGYEIKGEHGFGYDPIFYLPEYQMTSAQISPDEKNRISHRSKALKKMFEILEKRCK